MKFKLDENLSPSLANLFDSSHDVHSVAQEGLSGQGDTRVIEACTRERRALITFDLDFANIVAYPPSTLSGIVVLRLSSQAHSHAEAALRRVLALLAHETLAGALWIVEDQRIRIHG